MCVYVCVQLYMARNVVPTSSNISCQNEGLQVLLDLNDTLFRLAIRRN